MSESKKSRELVPQLRFKGFTDPWEQRKLGDLLTICSGASQKEIEVPDGKFPILGTGGEIGRTNTPIYTEESVLIGRKGTIDKPVFMNTPFWTVDTLFYSKIKPNNVGLFIFSLFQTISWKKYDASTGVPSLTSSTIHSIICRVPNAAEQSYIGEFFKILDDLIAACERKCELLEKRKRYYLQQIFSQEIRFSGFNDPWEQRKLGDVAKIVGGGTPDSHRTDYWNGDINWYTPAEIGKKRVVHNSARQITESGLRHSSAQILPKGSILFTSRATIGLMAFIAKPSATNQGFQSFIVNDGCSPDFVYAFGAKIRNWALRHAAGSTFIEISGRLLAKMPLSIPEYCEQVQIGEFFKTLDDLIAACERKRELLEKAKHYYLQQLFI
jgi:type I restriction enzyme, S subunit